MALYTAIFNAVTVTAAQDLFELTSPVDGITIIHAVEMTQSSEIGDVQEEGLNLIMRRGQTTTGTGGAVTPQPVETGSSAYGGVVKSQNITTGKASGGTPVTLRAENWNVRLPYLWLPTPEMRFILGPSIRFTVELLTTPADAITMSGILTFEELGG